MKNCHKKLKELIEGVVLPDIADHMDEIFEIVAKDKNASDKHSKELDELHEMRDEFQEVLKEIEDRELEMDECVELYEEITEMLKGDEEE